MFKKITFFKRGGFTFLEILLVVTLFIIGTIIVSSSFGDLQKKARDSKRVSDIGQIQKALNIYYSGLSRFPVSEEESVITGEDDFSRTLINEMAMKKVPTDPLYPAVSYRYISNGDGSNYQLKFCLETESIPEYKSGCDNSVGP